MSDLISRQALMKEFSDFVRASNSSDFAQTPTWNDAVSLVGSMPSTQQQDIARDIATIIENEKDMRVVLKQPRWIPCSERLPEVNGRYYVTRGLNACGALWNRVYIVNYSDLMGLKSERIWWDGNVGKSDFERIDDVIAWMPLPEPFKGEES